MPKVNLEQDYPEIVNEWSAHGVMDELVVDGGRDFFSVSLERACAFFNIDWTPSPRLTPWFKPHIERFLKTLNNDVADGVLVGLYLDPPHHALVLL
jgi:hypothetical protein